MTGIRLLAALALMLSAGPAPARDYKAGAMTIGHPWSRATPPGAKIGGGYLTIMNQGGAADRLVSVEVPFAEKAEIHESSVEDGVAKMREIPGGVEVKAGDMVEFAPGGKHLMFIGLQAPLAKGEKVKGALIFEKAGRVEVEFAVEAPGAKPAAEGMDHKGH